MRRKFAGPVTISNKKRFSYQRRTMPEPGSLIVQLRAADSLATIFTSDDAEIVGAVIGALERRLGVKAKASPLRVVKPAETPDGAS